jgi:hypothetical protein
VSDPSRLLGNLVAVIAVGLGMAYLIDQLLVWLGWRPWIFCTLFPVLDLVIGHTVALILAMVSAIVFMASRFKNVGAGVLFLGAVVLSSVPSLFSGYLGAYCSPDGQLVTHPLKSNPAGR